MIKAKAKIFIVLYSLYNPNLSLQVIAPHYLKVFISYSMKEKAGWPKTEGIPLMPLPSSKDPVLLKKCARSPGISDVAQFSSCDTGMQKLEVDICSYTLPDRTIY